MRAVAAALFALILALAGPAVGEADAAKKNEKKQFYVSLGDSYSVGYQPGAPGQPGGATTEGYANLLPQLLRDKGYRLKLVNFGCAVVGFGETGAVGETTSSMLERTTPCLLPAVDGRDYAGQTQIGAAEEFIRKHRKRIAVITLSIGGNDITQCVRAADPVACVVAAVETIRTNVSALAGRLRAAAGAKTPVVGLTYPDVILGLFLSEQESERNLAALSVVAFRDLINPALRTAYESNQELFVDVTEGTDAYVPFDQVTNFPPYGDIPIAVATVCRITYFCERRDIHANAEGYRIEAELIAAALPSKK